MKIAPKAKLNDGLMDVVAVKKTNRLKLLKLFPKIFSGNHVNDSVVKYHQIKSNPFVNWLTENHSMNFC